LSEFDIYLKGFVVTFSLIVAIGAQNAYLLKLGLIKKYVLVGVVFCIFADIVFITMGVYGLGYFLNENQLLINIFTIIGIVFLLAYAFISFKSAFKNETMDINQTKESYTLKKVLTTFIVFTVFNPHVYIDTILLIGSVGASVPFDLKYIFLLGAISASALWFSLLGYGARVLIPLFQKPLTWKIFDFLIGVLMLYIAYSLLGLLV
jgi:L-lysine exporter family protein LysE/ArgO